MRCHHRVEGITGLEMIITIIILLLFVYISASLIFGATGSTGKAEGGIVVGAASGESEIIVVDGESDGIQDTGGEIMDINIICESPDKSIMGSCLIPVRLLTGSTGRVDMSLAGIIFSCGTDTEILPFTENKSVKKPSWTIADRTHMIPLMEADEDIYLEPNEVFTLLIYPGKGVVAGKGFTVTVSPGGVVPLETSYIVPPAIRTHRIAELLPG